MERVRLKGSAIHGYDDTLLPVR